MSLPENSWKICENVKIVKRHANRTESVMAGEE